MSEEEIRAKALDFAIRYAEVAIARAELDFKKLGLVLENETDQIGSVDWIRRRADDFIEYIRAETGVLVP